MASSSLRLTDPYGIAKLDTIIANAGIGNDWSLVAQTAIDEVESHFKVNSVGPFALYLAMRPMLLASAEPKFVVISTELGSIGLQVLAMATIEYSFFHVSKTTSIEKSAELYRNLRLKALQTSPESFSSTFEIESAFTEDDWIKRLIERDRENFVCAATTHGAHSTTSVEWVGQLTIRGPSIQLITLSQKPLGNQLQARMRTKSAGRC
ncbi:hypothetical protein CEP54_010416 [Fusarium duplospermum]|uniref:Uncharacterized protein n=1 Tax=Fusarium duplospermum TaxID=1325734 RepID=A0A428PK64_9HYPO|nr:hypothetical protein CEP54_010416 [Fusarium duplospermum]